MSTGVVVVACPLWRSEVYPTDMGLTNNPETQVASSGSLPGAPPKPKLSVWTSEGGCATKWEATGLCGAGVTTARHVESSIGSMTMVMCCLAQSE